MKPYLLTLDSRRYEDEDSYYLVVYDKYRSFSILFTNGYEWISPAEIERSLISISTLTNLKD